MTVIVRSPAWAPCHGCGAFRRRRRCQPSRTSAGLLDLFRGGSEAQTLPEEPQGTALLRWLEGRGLPPQKLAAVAVPGAGRGLAATQPISKGEALLRIPQQLVITPAAAAQQSSLAPLLESTPLPAWSVLALWLAEARAAGPAGEWWPYIQLLPDHTGSVLEWSEDEVGWLAGSQLAEAAAEIRGAAAASWQEMQPLLAQAAAAGLGPPGAFSREALQSAFSMLLSRLVRLPSLGLGPPSAAAGQARQAQQAGAAGEPPGTEALLPWADLLNHSPASTAFLDWDPAEAAVVLRTDRRYWPGEEVHISYGQKTGGELLLSYGFTPKPADNPHDGCKLRLALRPGDPAAPAKAAALAAFGMGPSQLFPLRMAAAPFELVHYAALAAAEVGSEQEAGQLAQRLFGAGDIPPTLQQPALEAVVAACQAAMKAYPSSLEADRAELAKLEAADAAEAAAAAGQRQSGGSDAGQQRRQRRHQVLQVLVYERQVLARTAFVLQQELKDLRRMAGR
ncbi:hypothetical protein ABPG75_011239 [Micractinium tetrahymenae]